MAARGKFITVEGVEGAGKSSNLAFILQLLEAAGMQVVLTREPGGTPLGEDLRQLLLGHKHTGMTAESELLLMFAARAEHLARVIVPALDSGSWVLCDRFTDASYAYQGGGRGVDIHRIRSLKNWVLDNFEPDLTLLLDLPVSVGLKRAGDRSDPDRFERENDSFFNRVREAYLNIAREAPDRVRIIDASLSPSAVQEQIARNIREFLAG